jgi:Zn-dependent M28 family amino/carboxypeptidase
MKRPSVLNHCPGKAGRIGALLAVLILVVPACRSGSDLEETVTGLQSAALHDDLSWELLSSLTIEVGPRMGGSTGDALAVAWAQQQMQRLGFDRVWLEAVEFPLWERRSETASIIEPRHQELAVTALGGSPSSEGILTAEVVHFSDLDALQDANPSEVRGKIAFISARMSASPSGDDYDRVVQGRSKGAYVAAVKGAAALIIRSVGTDNDRVAHTGAISGSETGPKVPAAAISNPDADLLLAMIETTSPVSIQLELDCGFNGMATSYNVIGEFDGRDPDAGIVVIGGHLDSWDLATGAQDDATGVAITLAAAHRVADLPVRPRRGIRVVLFANEEQGVYGGKAYAVAHSDEVDRHMIGAESDLGSGRIYRFRSRVNESARFAIEELERLLKPLGIPHVADKPAGGGADLGQMRKLGMPVVDLDHDASAYFDVHHTANDTLDKVDPADMRFNVAAWITFLYFAAETETVFGPVSGE